MNRIKRWLLGILLAVLLLLGSAVLLLKIYEEEIKRIVIQELNEQLISPVQVGGDIYVSLFEHFPAVSLSFRQIRVQAVENGLPQDYSLAEVDRLSLSFSLLDLLRGKYELQQLSLSDAHIDLRFDAAGNPNFLIWKSDSSRSPDAQTAFAIRKLQLQRVKLHYGNAADQQDLSLSLTDADFRGDFSQRNFRLHAGATLEAGSLQFNGQTYLGERALQLAFAMEVDLDAREVRFADSRVELNREKLQLTGYHRWNNPQRTKLSFIAQHFDAQEVLSYFKDQNSFLRSLDINGELALSGKIDLSPTESLVDIRGKLSEGQIGYLPYQLQFTGQTDATARFSKKNGLSLHFNNIRLQRKNESFRGSLSYADRSQLIDTRFSGQLQLENWQTLLDSLSLGTASGQVKVAETAVRFRLGEDNWPEVAANLQFSQLDWVLGATRLAGFSGSLRTEGAEYRNLQLTQLKGRWNDSPLTARLTLYNYPAYFYRSEGRYSVSGEASLDRFAYLPDTTRQNPGESTVLERLDLQLKLGKFDYPPYQFTNIHTRLTGHPDNLAVKLQTLDLAGGSLQGDLRWQAQAYGYSLRGGLSGQDVGIKALFTQFNNFDQDFITDKNLDGRLSFSSSLDLGFDHQYRLLLPRLQLTADLKIAQGSLTNFAPLQGLARFVDAQELKNIRFSELSNRIDIRDGRISIPNMLINTNAAAFSISGEHDFENAYTYYVKLSLTDLWQKKKKRISFDPALAEPKLDGGVNLYLVIKGKGSDFTISYDKLVVKNQLKEVAATSATDIKRLIREELKGEGTKTYENDNLDAFKPIEAVADTLEKPKEPEFDPVYLRKPKSRKDAFKRDKR